MKKRLGISFKVQDSSGFCNFCNLQMTNISCLICKKVVCENCISYKNKYCTDCDNSNLRNSNKTYIKVPIGNNKFKFLIIEDKSYFWREQILVWEEKKLIEFN